MESPTLRVMIVEAGFCSVGDAITTALQGRRVIVFESAPQPHHIGAGIQITPNGVRLLRRWGVSGYACDESCCSQDSVSDTMRRDKSPRPSS